MRLLNYYMSEEDIKEKVESFRYVHYGEGVYRRQIGVVVLDKQGRIGWSLYNENQEESGAALDLGLLIALNRAEGYTSKSEVGGICVGELTDYNLDYDLGSRVNYVVNNISDNDASKLIAVVETVDALRKAEDKRLAEKVKEHIENERIKST